MSTLPKDPSPLMVADGPTTGEGAAGRPPRRRWLSVVKGGAWVAVGAAFLVVLAMVAGPLVLPYRTYFVRSGSMEPTMPVGALAVYRPVSAQDLHPGDVIAFTRPGGQGEVVSHRIVRAEAGPDGDVFVTRGDANGADDEWRVPATGTGWRYSFHVPDAGYVLGVLGSTRGRLVVVALTATVFAGLALAGIWRRAGPSEPDADGDDAGAGGATTPTTTAKERGRVKDSLSVVIGHTELLLRSTPLDDDRRIDVVAIRLAAERIALDLFDVDLAQRDGTDRAEAPAEARSVAGGGDVTPRRRTRPPARS